MWHSLYALTLATVTIFQQWWFNERQDQGDRSILIQPENSTEQDAIPLWRRLSALGLMRVCGPHCKHRTYHHGKEAGPIQTVFGGAFEDDGGADMQEHTDRQTQHVVQET